MNIFQQYGIKEVADVCLYSIELDENDDEIYVPVLYLDTLKVSTVEETAENTSARGGLRNPKLITWDYGKEITVNLEDALFSPASQSMVWGGKLNTKTLKLYLRNFFDRGTDNSINDSVNRNAILTVTNFSDFIIIPDRNPSYEDKANFNKKNTTGYVGGTSIYCWLVDAQIASVDDSKKVLVDDLILFYREQTQKWYFFNGKGPKDLEEFYYTTYADGLEKYAIGYQYGKETFEWIRDNIANFKEDIKGYEYHIPAGNYTIKFTTPILESYIVATGTGGGSMHKWIDDFTYTINLTQEYTIKQPRVSEENLVKAIMQAYFAQSTVGYINNGWFSWDWDLWKNSSSEKVFFFGPLKDLPNKKDVWEYNYYIWAIKMGQSYDGRSTYYLPITNPFMYTGTDHDAFTKENKLLGNIDYLNSYRLPNLHTKDFSITLAETAQGQVEYENVAKETINSWLTNPPCDKYDRGPEYSYIDGDLCFLTQDLFIDGYRTDKCARNIRYSEMTSEELTTLGYEPWRYHTSVDVEYNTNIVPPQETVYQVDNALDDVIYLERIEKCKATNRFCIDTDVNTKHGQYRYLRKYDETELTVFLDPKTMQPYEPNTFEYYRTNGQRITGNLRVFKQYETYYKWTRTKAVDRTSLGKQIIVDSVHFPGTYRLVGETYIRSRATGKDHRYQFEIPLCKMGANNNITLQADGDPTTFSMTLTAMRRQDGVMMKLTQYEVENTKFGNYTSGSTQIVPGSADKNYPPEYEGETYGSRRITTVQDSRITGLNIDDPYTNTQYNFEYNTDNTIERRVSTNAAATKQYVSPDGKLFKNDGTEEVENPWNIDVTAQEQTVEVTSTEYYSENNPDQVLSVETQTQTISQNNVTLTEDEYDANLSIN